MGWIEVCGGASALMQTYKRYPDTKQLHLKIPNGGEFLEFIEFEAVLSLLDRRWLGVRSASEKPFV